MSDDHLPIGLAVATSNSGDHVVARPSQIEVSLHGEAFDIYADEWKLNTRITLKVAPLRALMAPGLQVDLTMTLCHLARNRSPTGPKMLSTILKDYAKRVSPGKPIAGWRVVDLQNYRETLIQRFGHESYLIELRSFLKAWYDLRYPGMDRKVYEALNEMTFKGPEKGRAVRSMDPKKGPLEPTELHALAKDIQSAYEQDTLGLEHFSLSLFHIATGRRPSQSANLKCKDLDEGRAVSPDSTSISDDPKAPTETLLLMHVPRSKQRAATFRDEFRSVQWAPEFFAIFRLQQRMVQHEFESLLASQNWALQTQDLLAIQADLPLFPDRKRILASLDALSPMRQDGRHGQALQDLRATAVGAQWHHSGQEVTKMLQAAVTVAGSTSRTGESLSINALRLRHTKGANQLHPRMGTSPVQLWMPSLPRYLQDVGLSDATRTSIFDRHGYRDADGGPLKLRSHSMRHLLNTEAQRGKMTNEQIAWWSGRGNQAQNQVYNHMTEQERVDRAMEVLTDVTGNFSVVPFRPDGTELTKAADPASSSRSSGITTHGYWRINTGNNPASCQDLDMQPQLAGINTLYGRCEHDYRPIVEEDAELALQALGFTLRDLDWSKN